MGCRSCCDKLQISRKSQQDINQRSLEKIQQLTLNANVLEIELKAIPSSNDGVLIWKISSVFKKITESYRQPNSGIISPRFLSITGKHPLNAQLYLYGCNKSHPSYVSIHIMLSPGGTTNLDTFVTCCLVDQKNTHEHVQQKQKVQLNQSNIGTLCCFSKFIETDGLHQENSRFVKKDTIYIIIKVHENHTNIYNNYPSSVQHAMQKVNED